MKKFQFRLERVLQYRKLLKDEKTKELILSRNKLFGEMEHLKELEMAALLNAIEDNIQITAEEIHLLGAYGARLKEDIEHQKEEIERSQEAVAKAEDAYIEAAKDEETLATLKEKRKAEYADYLNKEELKAIDEMTTQRSAYNKLNF